MIEIFFLFFLIGSCCEFIDSYLGGGYGTIISPLLLLLGYSPLVIIPSILLSEIITGLLAAFLFQRVGHLDFKSGIIIVICASIGAILGSISLISIPKFYISFYISLLIITLGIIMIKNYRLKKYSRNKSGILGILIGFNKAFSGGGFGPVLVAGLNILGLDSKRALGTTLFSEGLTCITAIFILVTKNIQIFYPGLFVPLCIGSILGSILGSKSAIKTDAKKLKKLVAIFLLFLGIVLLIRLLL